MTAAYAFFAILVIWMFLLYRQGFAVSKCVKAVLFVFRRGKRSDYASLNSCSGWVRHRLPVRHDQIYEFNLDCRLVQGETEVTLMAPQRHELLRLNQYQATGCVNLNKKTSYSLCWSFQNATGKCELRW